jgi:cysteine desulfurase/selenocysteine lyase
MLGPTGVGFLWGKKEHLENMPPFLGGGDMIHEVFTDSFTANEIPYKFEAGTPNIAGVIGFGAALQYIESVGFNEIQKQEHELTSYLYDQINLLPFVQTYGFESIMNHIPTVAFTMTHAHPHDIADILGSHFICIRAGHHCTQPLHDFLRVPATARASLIFYNTITEIDVFIKELKNIDEMFR